MAMLYLAADAFVIVAVWDVNIVIYFNLPPAPENFVIS